MILTEVTAADEQISTVSVGNGLRGRQPRRLRADDHGERRGPRPTPKRIPVDGPTRHDAKSGCYAFTVAIRDLATTTATADTGAEVVKKTADADGNPLEAHVGTGIDALAVTSVTDAGRRRDPGGTAQSRSGLTRLITITLTATGEDGLPPINGSAVTPLAGSGFVGSASADAVQKTNDAGEVSVDYRADTATQALAFTANGASARLLVNVVDPDAPVDTGPVIYSLADSAGQRRS